MELCGAVWSVCVPACTGRAAPLLRLACTEKQCSVPEYSIAGHTCTIGFSDQAWCLLIRERENMFWVCLAVRTLVLVYRQYRQCDVSHGWAFAGAGSLFLTKLCFLMHRRKLYLVYQSCNLYCFFSEAWLLSVWGFFPNKHQHTSPCPWHRLILLCFTICLKPFT